MEEDRINKLPACAHQGNELDREVVDELSWGSQTCHLVSQWVVGIRVAVLPIMRVRWHPGHPDRNSSDRIYDVSRNVCPSGIDASIRCEVGAERSCRQRRINITLAELEPHRSCSGGTKTQTTERAGERRFADLRPTTATAALRRNRGLMNERVSTALGTTVGSRTLGRIGGVLERRRGG
jgi:hypothetical protein